MEIKDLSAKPGAAADLAVERTRKILTRHFHHLLLESGFTDELIQLSFESRAVHGHFNGLIHQRGIKQHIGQLHGMNPVRAGCDQGNAIANGFDEITHQDGVRQGGVAKGDVDIPNLGLGEADLGLLAVLQHAGFVAGKVNLIILQHHFATCAGDFKTIGTRCLARGRDKHAGGTIGIFQISGDVVLDFNVMEAPQLREAPNLAGHADQPLERIKLMQALVQ